MTPSRRYYLNGQAATRLAVRDSLQPVRVDDLLSALLDHRITESRCPHCGTTEPDIEASGLVGCPLCYAVHETYLLTRFGTPASG